MSTWTAADVADQAGRTAVVTGANSGIGFETARVLAARGANVILACRDLARAQAAAERIAGDGGGGQPGIVHLDLASLDSVREAAAQLHARHERLDLLVNNAGLMYPPYGKTEDGFELQFGTNHLGHFALTGLLLDLMLAVPGSRVVTVSSQGHRAGRINFGDLQSERRYSRNGAYAQSKLANLLFTYELQRRLAGAGAATAALAAHPGLTRTELTRYLPGWMESASVILPFQDAAMGALPTLRAATDAGAHGGEYYGPGGIGEIRGYPRRVGSTARSRDTGTARRLWEESLRLTGVSYPL